MSDFWNQFGSRYDEVNQASGGLADHIKNTVAPKWQATQQPTQQPEQSFGLAGLPGAANLGNTLSGGALSATGIPMAGAAMAVAGAAAVPLALAYGVGKLIAPQQADEAVGHIKNWLQQKVAPLLNKTEAIGSAAEIGMGKSLPGSKFIEKALPPETQQTIEQIQAQHPIAEKIGEIQGTGAQMMAPGVTLLKGASLGGKIAAAAGNAAINAVPYSVGAGLNTYSDTGDVGQALKSAGLSEAMGGAVGGALGGVGEVIGAKLPNIASWLRKGAQDTVLREGLGIDPRVFRKVATFGNKLKGTAAQDSANSLRNELVQLANESGIRDKVTREAWLTNEAQKWKGVDKAWDDSGTKVSDLTAQIVQHPEVQNVISENPQGEQWVNDLIGNADKKSGIVNVRDYLQRQINKSHLPGATTDIAEQATAAKAIRDTVDSAFVPPELKEDYAKYKTLNDALTHHDMRLESLSAAVGSPTAGRMIGAGLAGGVMGLGAPTGDSEHPLGRRLLNSVGGAILGSVGQRIGVAAANKGMGAIASKIAPMIPEHVQQLENIGNQLGKLGARGVGMVANALTGGQPPEVGPVSSAPPEQAPSPVGGITQPATAQQAAAVVPPSPSQGMSPYLAQNVQDIKTKESLVGDQGAAESRVVSRSSLQASIDKKIQDRWKAIYPPLRPDYQTFYNSIKAWSGDFDPSREETMRILGGADYKKYQQTYLAAMNMHKMGPDLIRAISHIPGGLSDTWDPLGKEDHDNLVNSIWQASSGDSKPPGKDERMQIENRLTSLRKLARRGQLGKDKALSSLLDIMKNEGLPVQQLEQYGAFQ